MTRNIGLHLLFLFPIFILSIVLLYFSIQDLSNTSISFVPQTYTNNSLTTIQRNQNQSEIFTFSNEKTILGFLVFIALISLLIFLDNENRLLTLLRIGVIVLFIFGIFYILTYVPVLNIYLVEISLSIPLIILIILFSVLILVLSSLILPKIKFSKVTNKEERELEIIRNEFIDMIKSISILYQNKFDNVREFIINCYKSFCDFLKQYNIDNPHYLTAREFEYYLSNILNYKSKELHELTLIFEEARYNKADIGLEMGERTLNILNKIKDDLEKIIKKNE